MKTRLALLSFVTLVSLFSTAQVPSTLKYSIPPPPTGPVQSGSQFGYCVATDGPFSVVGARFDDLGATNAGVAKVFDSATGVLLYTLRNPSPVVDDNFGYMVAISGTRVVVGAINDDVGATDAGSAYVYDLASATPTVPVVTLNNPSPAAGDWFGYTVAISATRVVVGAINDDTGATDTGSAYVYDLTSGTPTVPVFTIGNPTPAAADEFGWAMSISGTRLAVSSIWDNGTSGAVYVYDLAGATPTVPSFTLTSPPPSAGDSFGDSVAISGTRLVVSATGDDLTWPNGGGAYVFDLSSATPTVPVLTVSSPNPGAFPLFGHWVAITGTRIVIGTPYDDALANNAGIVFVYDLTSGTPTVPVLTINNPAPAADDLFGNSVAVSGSRLVIGAPTDDAGAADAGSVYFYDLGSGTPAIPVRTLNNPSPAAGDQFGLAMAISGTRVVIGAYLDDMGASDAGSAYVYDLSSATPTVPVVTLNNPSPAANDYFGLSVAISGTRVVVGAHYDDTGATDAGIAYVFDLSSPTPTVPVFTLNNPTPAVRDLFGYSVAISGTRVVVGALLDDTGASDSGSAYVYDLNSATPTTPVATLNNPSPGVSDQFGFSVTISSTRVVVGARIDGTGAVGAGSAYVYDLGGGTPTVPVATLNNPVPDVNDYFGSSVAISGTSVVVGAVMDDTGATDAGTAYVYDLSSGTPTVPVATLNNPSPALGDQFGFSVAISGTQVVVGALYGDTAGSDAGTAYLYDLNSAQPSVPLATLNNPSPAVADSFGMAVAIDGSTVAVGAPFDDSIAIDKGYAYIYGPASGGGSSAAPLASLLGDVVTGELAPNASGLSDGTKFDLLGRGGFIAENGHLAFPGELTGPGVDGTNFKGFWKDDGTLLKRLARTGDDAPETGATAAKFSDLPLIPGINDAGQVTLFAALATNPGSTPPTTIDNDTGLWSELGGTGFQILMREGDDIPGLPSGTQVGRFGSGCFATADTGAGTAQAAFTITMKGASTDTALLRASIAGPTVTAVGIVARENASAPGTGETFGFLNSTYTGAVRMDAQGNIVFGAALKPSNKSSIWYQPVAGGDPAAAVVGGSAAPGTTATFAALDLPVMGGSGTFAFRGVLNLDGDNADNSKNDGIWRGTATGPFTNILRRGDSNTNRPGLFSGAILTANPNIKAGNIWSGWLTNANHGAWLGWVDLGGNGISPYPYDGNFTASTDTFGIYTDMSGTMSLLISSGDPAPGIAGASLFFVDHPVVGGVEQLAFIGTVTGGGTTAGVNDKGIWRTGPNGGAPSLVLRTGDSMTTTQGVKTIADVDLPGSNLLDHQWETPVMDGTGRMIVYVTFTDGSTAQILVP